MAKQRKPSPKKAPEAPAAEAQAPKSPEAAFEASSAGKKIKVEFVASPTGMLNLAYNIGDQVEFPEKQADTLIEFGLAKPVK